MVSETTQEKTEEQYSFSKLSSWWTCPYGYKQRYIDLQKGEGNAFSSFGTLVHSLMERYAKGELEIWDLSSVYEWEFNTAVPEKFPYNKYVNLHDSYYSQGLSFLKRFQGYDKCKILGVEEKFTIPVEDWLFVGVIDLVFEDESGRLIIRDYKSKGEFKDEKEKAKYARQLYLYSLYVKKKYGRYPDELQFLMFRKNMDPVRIPFDEDALQEAIDWAVKTVKIIREAFDYPPTCDIFYGQNLCNFRHTCSLKPKTTYKSRQVHRKREK